MVILKRAEMGGGRRGVKPCDPSKVKVERGGSGYVKPVTVLKGAGIVGNCVSVKGAEKPKEEKFVWEPCPVEPPKELPEDRNENLSMDVLSTISPVGVSDSCENEPDPTKESWVDGANIPAKESVGGEVCMPELPMEAAEREWTEEEYRARDERLAAADAAGVAFPSVEGGGGRRKRRRRKHRHG